MPLSLSPSLLTSMLGEGFAVELARPALVPDGLYPEELQYIAPAVPKRKAEFGTARICARRALARLGVAPCSLVPNSDRSPRWPLGVVGSIAHGAGCCVVAVTCRSDVIGVGLDVERATPLNPALERMICTASERAWLGRFADQDRALLAKLHFSAKEALYKCQYPTTGALIDFLDVELTLDLERESYRIAQLKQKGAAWDLVSRIEGRFRWCDGIVVTTALLSAAQ